MLKSKMNKQKGMAVFEMIPIIFIFMLLLNYGLGYFGAIHTGILGSIAARNYAFETFRNRVNLTYFRDRSNAEIVSFFMQGNRVHSMTSEATPDGNIQYIAAGRSIDFFAQQEPSGTSSANHNKKIMELVDGQRFNGAEGVNPIWVRPSYGICLNVKCGD